MLEELARENPAAAWEKVRDLLRERMSYGAYEQHLKPVDFASLDGSRLILLAASEFSAAWLTERAGAMTQSLVRGVFNRPDIEVVFFASADSRASSSKPENQSAQSPQAQSLPVPSPAPPQEKPRRAPANEPPRSPPTTLENSVHLTEARLSLRDLFVRQNREIPIPGYFRRWIPYLGPTLSWMVVAFRQIFYLHAGSHARPESTFPATSDEISRWSGLARSTFWENIKDPRLGWFVTQVAQERRWKPDAATGQPRQKPNLYRFTASMPLTPADVDALRTWLVEHDLRGDPCATLELALQTPAGEIFPIHPPAPDADFSAMPPRPLSVQDVVQQTAGKLSRQKFGEVQKLADRLEAHLIPRSDLIFVTWYFLQNWVPRLGGGPAWLVTLLRDRCFFSRGDAPSRRVVRLHGGAAEAASMLGLNRPKTVSEWLPPLNGRAAWETADRKADARRAQRKAATRDLTGRFLARMDGSPSGTWQFQVAQYGEEPLIEEHQLVYDTLLDWIGAYLECGDRSELDALLSEMGQARRARFGLSQEEEGTRSGLSSGFGTARSGLSANSDGRDTDSQALPGGRVPDAEEDLERREDDSHEPDSGAFRTDEKARFRLVLKQVLNTFTTAEALNEILQHLMNNTASEETETETQEEDLWEDPAVAVDENWNLERLLARAKIGTRRKLVESGVSPQAFVSHLCYASAPDGSSIKDVRAYAASALLEDGRAGAGGIFDRLAELPPPRLAELLRRALEQPYAVAPSGDRLFDEAFRGAERARLVFLANVLGVCLDAGPDEEFAED